MAILLDNKPLDSFEDTKEVINILNCSDVQEVKKNLFLIKSNGATFLKEKTNTWRNNPVFEFNVLVGNILHKNVKFVVSEESETMINHKQLGIRKIVNKVPQMPILEESNELLLKTDTKPAESSQTTDLSNLKKAISETFIEYLKDEQYSPELHNFFNIYTEGFKQQFMQISEKISKREMYRAMESGGGTNAVNYVKGGVIDGDLTITGNLSVVNAAYINIESTDQVAKKIVTSIGDGVNEDYTVSHNLSTKDILVSVLNSQTNAVVYPYVEYTTLNSISLSFDNPVPDNAYRVIIIG
jgi:hypothetical protein